MEPTSGIDDGDSMSQVMFTNLLLLGLDVEDMEAVYKIPFNRDMFKGYNKAGANAVLHFLFYNLNSTVCGEQFRDCWPIVDKKSEAQFRKTCFHWLVGIKKSETDVQWPILNASSLQFPGGPKFVHILFRLSIHVLKKNIPDQDQNHLLVTPSLSTTTLDLTAVKLISVQDNTNLDLRTFMNQMYITNSSHQMWNKYASELVHGIREISKSQREIEQEKRLVVTRLAENAVKQGCSLPVKRTLNMFDGDRDETNTKRRQRLMRVKASWEKVNIFYEGLYRKIIQAVLDHSNSSERLDANDIGVRIPGLLLKQCEKEIRQQQIDNVYIGGRLNMLSVLQLWNLCLHLYLEQLEEANLPDVSKEVPALATQAHKFHSFLKEIQALREEISSVFIPELEQSIEDLRKESRLEMDDSTQFSQSSLQPTTPTLPSSFVNQSRSDVATPAGLLSPKTTKKHDTPTVLSEMIASIAKVTQKTQSAQPSRLTFDQLKTAQRSSPLVPAISKNTKQTRGASKTQREVSTSSKQPADSSEKSIKVANRRRNVSTSKAASKNISNEKEPSADAYQSILDQMAESVVDSVIEKHDTSGAGDAGLKLSTDPSWNVDQNHASSFSLALMLELDQDSASDINATLEDSFAPFKHGILLDKSPMKLKPDSTLKSPVSSAHLNPVSTLKSPLSTSNSPIRPLGTSLDAPLSNSPLFSSRSPSVALDSSFNEKDLLTLKSPAASQSESTFITQPQSLLDLERALTSKSPPPASPDEIFRRHHRPETKLDPIFSISTPPSSSSAWDIQKQVDDLFSQGCKIFEDIDDDDDYD